MCIQYIYLSQSTRDTLIVQLLPVRCWRVGQLRAPLRLNPQQISAYTHFIAIGSIHIFVGIANCMFGGYMVPASQPFLAYIILPAWLGHLSLLSRGGRRI